MKKSLLALSAIATIASSGFGTAFAATTTSNNEEAAKNTLQNYLTAAEAGDINQLIASVNDTRMPQSRLGADYQQTLSLPSNQLVQYKITGSNSDNSGGFFFNTNLKFKDGHTVDYAYDVVQDNNSWKVLIENAPVTPQSSAFNTAGAAAPQLSVSPMSAPQIGTWNWSVANDPAHGGGGWFYSNATFTANASGTNIQTLNLQQRSEYMPNVSADITYEIAQHHTILPDTVWGTIDVAGNYWGSGVLRYIYGSGTLSNCQVAFRVNDGITDDSFGEVYDGQR
ncbi:hypothetical protein [Alicyclobacillus dauci]|uniref:Uncharacterized protein n=1 Tax=Alicyclobacillus dauci TaxID=1475485 RepID=A0ABY6Z3S6_9BACL|nr:hypothetical protein [Alicyclobacillus dauci]WAH37173.1 hypothetical protein NZD86_01060 [Alicyclobacillus dauci]